MEIQPDFKELLVLFNEQNVEYLIVGGYALAFHGAPRYTGDLDILVRPDPANAQRILKSSLYSVSVCSVSRQRILKTRNGLSSLASRRSVSISSHPSRGFPGKRLFQVVCQGTMAMSRSTSWGENHLSRTSGRLAGPRTSPISKPLISGNMKFRSSSCR